MGRCTQRMSVKKSAPSAACRRSPCLGKPIEFRQQSRWQSKLERSEQAQPKNEKHQRDKAVDPGTGASCTTPKGPAIAVTKKPRLVNSTTMPRQKTRACFQPHVWLVAAALIEKERHGNGDHREHARCEERRQSETKCRQEKRQQVLAVAAGTAAEPVGMPRVLDCASACCRDRSVPCRNCESGLRVLRCAETRSASMRSFSTGRRHLYPNKPDTVQSLRGLIGRLPTDWSRLDQEGCAVCIRFRFELKIWIEFADRCRAIDAKTRTAGLSLSLIAVMIGPPGGVLGEYRCHPGSMLAFNSR